MTDWTRALDRELSRLAAERRTATYADLAERAGAPAPHRIHNLTLALEAMIREDHAAARPLRAAVAVSRARRGLPGPGFFQLCRALGRYFGPDDGPQAETYHRLECDRVFAASRPETGR